MRKVLCILLFVSVVLAQASTSGATTLRQASTRELAVRAERIVTGRCVATRVEWVGRLLVTLATFEVEETLKGEPTREITVSIPGGADPAHWPPIELVYAGAPRAWIGQEALLFLRPSAELRGAHALVGFSQGFFTLAPGPGGRVGQRDLGSVTLMGGSGASKRGASESFALAALKQEIAAALAEATATAVEEAP